VCKVKSITEQQMSEIGYVYLGEYGVATKEHRANQLWRWRDELVLYDSEEERIVWREYNEPRYQCDYTNQYKPNHFGRKEHS
jgi:hypothetical protein